MAVERTKLIVGNWKMNGLAASLAEMQSLAGMLTTGGAPKATIVICPPATLLAQVSAQGAQSGIVAGGQDCHPAANGAHTGDISAAMLVDAGAQYVIVGHSERRADHGETDALVRAKAQAALSAGLTPIICVGETAEERKSGKAIDVVGRQVAASVPDEAQGVDVVVAYEPVWSIGTGVTPTSEEIAEMHAALRGMLASRFGQRGEAMRLLYGGSVKPTNARDILVLPEVDGALVGGASLLAKDFYVIISAVA